MRYFPIFVDCEQLNVLVVGGGEVATRKVELILKTPAQVTLVSPDLTPSLQGLVNDNKITYIEGNYQKALLENMQLVFVATADNALNQQISQDAQAQKVLANVVDSPALCKFITPSIIDRSPVTFAISSEGQSPVLIRYWRERLETLIPHTLGKIARFAGDKRAEVKAALDSVTKRRNFWERFFLSSKVQTAEDLEQEFQTLLFETDNNAPIKGELTVIKAPSHPDDLTLGELRSMQKADVGLYDNSVSDAILEMLRRDSERHLVTGDVQQQIDKLLAEGLRVCYLAAEPK